jgi:L-alanine-DL-glutamate epimerase-like enolase superfamily enzyme
VSERLISRFPYRDVVELATAHVILIDVAWTGGLTEARRIADMASTYHLSFAPHDCTGPVTALANLQLAASQPHCIAVEAVRGFLEGYYRDVLDVSLEVRDGVLSIPTGAGLGGALQPDFTSRPGITVTKSSEGHRPW